MVVAVDTLVRWSSFPPDISPSPSSPELSECRGLVKLRAVLTGVEEEEEEEEERWEEEDEDGARWSEEDEEEEVFGSCFSGLLEDWDHTAWPAFISTFSPPCVSAFSPLFTGRWFGLGRAPFSAWLSPPAPPSVPESSDSEELEVSRAWPERALKAWVLCSTVALLAEPLPSPPASPIEEEVSKLQGPSCNGTFLISILSFLSMRGAPEHSTTDERGVEWVWVWLWPDSDFADVEDSLLL